MKSNWKKIVCIIVVIALLGCGVGYYQKHQQVKTEKETVQKEVQSEEIETTGSMVYVFQNDNEINKMVLTDDVSDHIGQSYNEDSLKKELPITIRTSYSLDGQTMTSEELKGKTGHLKISYHYENHQSQWMNINGKKEQIYVPYAMLTGCILDNEMFKNVELSHGKLMDDGNHTILAGLALPGLSENLNIDTQKLDLPSSLVIEADVKDYEPIEVFTLATNQVFQNINMPQDASLESLTASLTKLDTAMSQLITGSTQLYEGLKTLDEKSVELGQGVSMLCDGANQLTAGSDALKAGATQLEEGANQLYSGLATLTGNNQQLEQGSKQIFMSLLNAASSQLKQNNIDVPTLTIDNYQAVLNQVIASLDKDAVYQKALSQVTQGVEAKRPMIKAAVTQEVKKQVSDAVCQKVCQMTKEQFDQAVENGLINKDVQMAVNNAIEMQMKSQDILTLIKKNTDIQVNKAIADTMASPEIQAQFEKAKEGLKAVIELKTSLDQYHAFYDGLKTYLHGVESAMQGSLQVKQGLTTLNDATGQLQSGAKELTKGLHALNDNVPVLQNGVQQLKDGSKVLTNGLIEFNDEGIQKLIDAVNGDVKGLVERINATINASHHHSTFAGIPDSLDQDINYLFRF